MWKGEKLARCARDTGLGDEVRKEEAERRVFQTETALDPSRSAKKFRILLGSPTLLCSGEAWACLLNNRRASSHRTVPFSLSIQSTWHQTPSCGWFLTLGKLTVFLSSGLLFLCPRCHLGIWVNGDPYCSLWEVIRP